MRNSTALLAGLALAAPGLAQDRVAAADPMASLVPSDAFFVARVTSYDAFQGMASQIVEAFAPGEDAPDLAELMPLDADLFAKNLPMTMAASLRSGQPVVTMILPALDPAGVVAAVEGQSSPGITRTSGSYVGICEGTQYEVGASSMLDSMQPGQVSMRLDLAPVLEAFGPMLDMGMDQMRMMAEQEASGQEMPMDMDMEAMMDFYFDGFESFIDSAEIIDMGFELRGGMLTVTGGLDVAEGSDMAGFGSASRANFAPVASRLGSGGMGTFLLGMDYADYERIAGGMMQDLLAIYPESMKAGFEATMNGYAEVMKACQPGIAMRFDMRKGMQMGMVAQAKEQASAVLPKARQILQGMSMQELGYSVSEASEATVSGVPGFRTAVEMDLEKMLATLGEEASAEMDVAEFEQIMEVMYGGNSMPLWYGAMDKFLLGAFGNGEGLAEQVVAHAKAADAAPAPMLSWAVDQIGGRTPSMAMNLDVVTLLRQIEPIVKQFDENADSLPEGLPASAPIAQWYLVENLRWSMGARMPLASFGELIRTLQ